MLEISAMRKTAAQAQRGGTQGDSWGTSASLVGAGFSGVSIGGDVDCEDFTLDFRATLRDRLLLRFFFAMAPCP